MLASLGLITFSFTNCIPSASEVAEQLAEKIQGLGGTTGQLNSADGSPLSGAFVAISKASSDAESTDSDTMALGRRAGGRGVLGLVRSEGALSHLVNEKGQFAKFEALTDDEGEICEDISSALDGVIATDCTGSDGTYQITADELPCDEELTLTAKKGSFVLTVNITLSCTDSDEDGEYTDEIVELEDFEFDEDCGFDVADEEDIDSEEESSGGYGYVDAPTYGDVETSSYGSIPMNATKARYSMDSDACHFEEARMAVVTGHYDEIQNVLAKLGFGFTDETGRLDANEEYDFTIIDGTDELDDEEFMNVDEFLSDIDNLNEYDIVFFNCGNDEDELSQDPEVLANLQQYVEEGGKIYATDWSFNFVEDPFPSFIDFYNDEDDAETAEDHHTAKIGLGGTTIDADVENADLADWLDNVAVNDGAIEEDCYILDEEAVDAKDGARNDDGTVTIGDFLGGWVVINGEHAGYEGESEIWIEGIVETSEGVADKPLTMTKDVGSGRLLYSSYHTAHDCPTQGFWAQERILQYLVFEL
jgi:hypothetical protein